MLRYITGTLLHLLLLPLDHEGGCALAESQADEGLKYAHLCPASLSTLCLGKCSVHVHLAVVRGLGHVS